MDDTMPRSVATDELLADQNWAKQIFRKDPAKAPLEAVKILTKNGDAEAQAELVRRQSKKFFDAGFGYTREGQVIKVRKSILEQEFKKNEKEIEDLKAALEEPLIVGGE